MSFLKQGEKASRRKVMKVVKNQRAETKKIISSDEFKKASKDYMDTFHQRVRVFRFLKKAAIVQVPIIAVSVGALNFVSPESAASTTAIAMYFTTTVISLILLYKNR